MSAAPAAGAGHPPYQVPYQAKKRRAIMPGPAIFVAILDYCIGGMVFIFGGFALILGSWIGGVFSLMPAAMTFGPVLSMIFAIFIIFVYSGLLIGGASGLLFRKMWGFVMSLVAAGFSILWTIYLVWAYIQTTRAVAIADEALKHQGFSPAARMATQASGLGIMTFLAIAFLLGHAISTFACLLSTSSRKVYLR